MYHSMMMASCLLLLAGAITVEADTFDSASRTFTHTITSEALGAEREIMVRTPPRFDPDRSYPVVFVTDGEWNFELVASYLDYMADNDVYPHLIVTGVTNVNRNRDFVPRADAQFDDTGEADRFLEFVGDEWIRFIAANYPVSGARILLGHSFGGVFALHAFFKRSEAFDAYIALGSSAWIADRVLFEEAEAWFTNPRNADAFVYMAVGEGDGGPTVPSSRQLAALFEAEAPDSLEWTFEITPRTDHFKNTVSGMHEGFMALFPAWGFAEQLTESGTTGGAAGVDQWFAAKRNELGYRFQPAWFDLGVAAMGLVRAGHPEAALATMRHLRPYHPDNAYVATFSAQVFEKTGRLTEAEAEYQRAIDITTRRGLHPNAIHLARLQRGLARVRAAQSAQDDS